MRVSWTARRSNQSILKEINLEYLLEGLMLKLKLQYFDHLRRRANLLEKTLTPWKKSYDQLRQHIKKAETLLCQKKVHLVKAMVFPVVMYGYETWTIKKAEPNELLL